MIPLTYILRKGIGDYKLAISMEKVNCIIYLDDKKIFAKTENKQETLIQTERLYSQDIKKGTLPWKMCHAQNEKWEKRKKKTK